MKDSDTTPIELGPGPLFGLYIGKAKDKDGNTIFTWSEDGDKWGGIRTHVSEEACLDQESVVVALDTAKKEGYTDVLIYRLILGLPLDADEIMGVRANVIRKQKLDAKADLIEEKGLSEKDLELLAYK